MRPLWKFIVIVSCLWLVGAIGYPLWEKAEHDALIGDALYGACIVLQDRQAKEEPTRPTNYRQCEEDRAEALRKAEPLDMVPVLAWAFIPVVALWLAGALLLAAGRWLGWA
jgi:hypothetical protein